MAGRILAEDVEALKRQADLADIVGDHTKLVRAGRRMKGLCPFHNERTPSFTVDPALGFYKCFGCDAAGDVYTFLERIEGLSFVEAVEHLARRVGYTLRYEEISAGQKRALGQRTRLVAANAAAVEFYAQQLAGPPGAQVRAYLSERGFDQADLERFRLGFAPLAWDALSRHLTANGFGERELETAGLAQRNQRGGLRDRFRGRLLFPVVDLSNDVIGFGGRVVPGIDYGEHEGPKYLNSPETPLYVKSRVLYAMPWARAEVVRTSEVLVCEGYTDVMALHKAGLTNAVATCGTAVGEEHLRLLGRYATRITLAFDADDAGATAAERAWRLSQEQGMEVRVLVLPSGEDPADVVTRRGGDALRALVADAEPVVRFLLRRAVAGHDLSTPEGKSAAVRACVPHLTAIADPVLRDQYARVVADDLIGVALPVIAEEVVRAGGHLAAVTTPVEVQPPSDRQMSARANLERDALRLVLQRADLVPPRWDEVEEDDFVHPKGRAVFRTLVKAGGPGTPLDAVVEAAEDDEMRSLVVAIALEDFLVEPDAAHAEMVVGHLLLHRLEREITQRKRELERLNPTTEPDSYRANFEQLIALEARRRDLRTVATG